jgi:hypothetical protein
MCSEVSTSLPMPMSIAIINKPEQYGLSKFQFDPIQNSPPSSWKMRLNKRIGDTKMKNRLIK